LSDYKAYRDAVGITNNDMIRALRGTFKRYGGATNAMVNNPDSYGVCLLPKAEKILAANFGYANGLSNVKQKPVRKACIRKKPNRLSVYLTDEMYSEIKAIMEREGYATVQEFLCKLLEDYVGG
jgi:hypothetical protein